MSVAGRIEVSAEVRTKLERLLNLRSTSHKLRMRARLILLTIDGKTQGEIGALLRISQPTVRLWQTRFTEKGIDGLRKGAPRPGRIPALPPEKVQEIVAATTGTTPPNATHWSIRTMAESQGVSRMTVQRVWTKHNLKPHLVQTFKFSNDPHFVEKLTDVVGLYMNPPDKSLVFSFDEKSQIQALDRTQLLLPLRPGIPARQTHDYKRNGTTTLFAALNVLDGTVISDCMPRHRHQEFIKFLKQIDANTPADVELHIIADNYATHKHVKVKRWLARHKRFHLHFTPTSSSWLNLVERWFRDLTDKRIRRGTFKSVPELIDAIEKFTNGHNGTPKKFVWHAAADKILGKIAKLKEVYGTLH